MVEVVDGDGGREQLETGKVGQPGSSSGRVYRSGSCYVT